MEGAASSCIISYRASELQALCLVSKCISTIAIEHLYGEVDLATGDDVDTIRYRYCITFIWYNQRVDEEISILSLESERDCNTFGSSERAAVIGGQPRPSVWSCRDWATFFSINFEDADCRCNLSPTSRQVEFIRSNQNCIQNIRSTHIVPGYLSRHQHWPSLLLYFLSELVLDVNKSHQVN